MNISLQSHTRANAKKSLRIPKWIEIYSIYNEIYNTLVSHLEDVDKCKFKKQNRIKRYSKSKLLNQQRSESKIIAEQEDQNLAVKEEVRNKGTFDNLQYLIIINNQLVNRLISRYTKCRIYSNNNTHLYI